MVWAGSEPTFRFELAVAPERGAIIERASGARFKVILVNKPLGAQEVDVTLERLNQVFEPLSNPRLYRTSRSTNAWIGTKDTGTPIKVVLEREDSLRGEDYGRVSSVLCARAPAASVVGLPSEISLLTVATDSGDSTFRVYAVEPLFSDGEYRFVLEKG